MKVYTIGHSNQAIAEFIALLKKHQINALADVRSHPYSRFLPHFNQEMLQSSIKAAGIHYVYLGQELGARPKNLSCYVNGKALYERIAETPEFSEGLSRICKGAQQYTIALMCAEQDPATCHRAILISSRLQEQGLTVEHIHRDGHLETHTQLEDRLLQEQGLVQNLESSNVIQLNFLDPNFQALTSQANPPTRKELVKNAIQAQADKIAYVDKSLTANTNESQD